MPERLRERYLKILLFTLLALLLCSIILLCLVPPISKDALVHHLAVPKLYLKHGGMVEIPSMAFSYFPMNLQLLYLIPLYFGNDIAPKLIHFAFALLTAGLIYLYLKSRANKLYAILGVILFLSIPIIVKLSITVYVDLGEMFFSFASLILILEWIKSGYQVRFLIYSGLPAGLALGTKYNGLITLAILTLFIPFIYSRYQTTSGRPFLRPVGYGMIFLLVSLAVFSPWMIRNYVWTKNPIYPLYNTWFNPSVPDRKVAIEGEPQRRSRGLFTYRYVIYNETGWQIALLPVRIFFEGRDGSLQHFDGKLNPFLLFLPFFAFLPVKKNENGWIATEKKILLFFSVLFFCFAFFSAVIRIRYISPIIPPLVILSVMGVKNLVDFFGKCPSDLIKKGGISFVMLVLVSFLFINANYIVEQFRYVDPFSYLNHTLNRDEYISKYRPEYPTIAFLNQTLPDDAKVLFLFLGKRGYYCEREYTLDTALLMNAIRASDYPEEIMDALRQNGITHLLIYHHLFEKWMTDNFSAEKQALVQQLFKKGLVSLFYQRGFGLWAINATVVL